MNSIIEQTAEKPLLLVVDDSAENLQVLNALLKDDYRLKLAKNGAKGIEIAQQHPQPDLILLDVIMPEMDGFQVCENLKADPKTTAIPVIFLTALIINYKFYLILDVFLSNLMQNPHCTNLFDYDCKYGLI